MSIRGNREVRGSTPKREDETNGLHGEQKKKFGRITEKKKGIKANTGKPGKVLMASEVGSPPRHKGTKSQNLKEKATGNHL